MNPYRKTVYTTKKYWIPKNQLLRVLGIEGGREAIISVTGSNVGDKSGLHIEVNSQADQGEDQAPYLRRS